jgi:nicotinamide mononucleotide transporter
LDIVLSLLCELLISKQSKWNFIVSLGIEITEIVTLILLAERFATMAVTIFFWIPIDIISFFAWNKHKDKDEENLTKVRKLTWWQDLILIAGIAVWTVGVGYLLSLIEVEGILSYNEVVQDVGGYLDACASAIGIANGVFILLRYREQWIAWYLVTAIEIVLNIMAGQWILLVLKAGYLTNTTYGYIKWSKYIKQRGKLLKK